MLNWKPKTLEIIWIIANNIFAFFWPKFASNKLKLDLGQLMLQHCIFDNNKKKFWIVFWCWKSFSKYFFCILDPILFWTLLAPSILPGNSSSSSFKLVRYPISISDDNVCQVNVNLSFIPFYIAIKNGEKTIVDQKP